VQSLLKIVAGDGWYTPKTMHTELSTLYEDGPPKWMSTRWIGNALKRLGFKDKRRVGRGIEYHLTPEQVQDMADRLGVTLPDEEEGPGPDEGGDLAQSTLGDDPNTQHLRRVAETQLKRAGFMTRPDFFSFMDAAGHRDQDVILAILGQDRCIEASDRGFRWVGEGRP